MFSNFDYLWVRLYIIFVWSRAHKMGIHKEWCRRPKETKITEQYGKNQAISLPKCSSSFSSHHGFFRIFFLPPHHFNVVVVVLVVNIFWRFVQHYFIHCIGVAELSVWYGYECVYFCCY